MNIAEIRNAKIISHLNKWGGGKILLHITCPENNSRKSAVKYHNAKHASWQSGVERGEN